MKLTISTFLLLSISVSAFSQSNSLEDLSKEVTLMVAAHSDRLDEEDKLSIKKNLRQVLQIFKMNGYGLPTVGSFICDNTNNQLVNIDSGLMVYDFSTYDNCQEALANIKMGKSFCDYTDNTLSQADGKLVYDFSDGVNCKEAIESIYKVKKFCDYTDNTLRRFDGVLLYDFSSKEECLKGLN